MSRTKRLTLIAFLAAVGVGLQIIEYQIPIPINLPGGKLGLANISTLIALYLLDPVSGFGVALLRAVLGSLLAGGVSGMIYSVSGAALSALVMLLGLRFARPALSLVGISVLGAVAHNLAQILVAAWVLNSPWVLMYVPVLCILAVVSGGFTGLAAKYCVKAMKNE